jgi:hypothetical protein
MKGCVASLEATSLFGNLRRTYRSPRDLTSKFTKGVGCPKRVGSQVPRGPALLHRFPLGVFPRIKVATIEISLIILSPLTNPACMKLTPSRSRLARNWKGQEPHWELRGVVYFKQISKILKLKCFVITRVFTDQPLWRS